MFLEQQPILLYFKVIIIMLIKLSTLYGSRFMLRLDIQLCFDSVEYFLNVIKTHSIKLLYQVHYLTTQLTRKLFKGNQCSNIFLQIQLLVLRFESLEKLFYCWGLINPIQHSKHIKHKYILHTFIYIVISIYTLLMKVHCPN